MEDDFGRKMTLVGPWIVWTLDSLDFGMVKLTIGWTLDRLDVAERRGKAKREERR